MKSKFEVSRRSFLGTAATAAAFSIVPRHVIARSGGVPPSEKLNLGCVGVGGMQGGGDVGGVSSENIYALCDVDENHLNKAAENRQAAKKYRDFRKMLDAEYKNLDGITVTIPDHMHATVSLWAMERGLGVYCQKPLTPTVWEARLLANAARKYKVPTQMGNQGYSCEATRMACETIWRGDIGDVKEVHAWNGGGFARGVKEWPKEEPVPAHLDWDLWTGRARLHPYGPKIAPIEWRGYIEYGTQMVGDWGVHILGPANWGLQLGSPSSVECIAVDEVNPVTFPHYACKFEFPERPNPFVAAKKMPPVTVYWYEGKMHGQQFKRPEGLEPDDLKSCNELFVGTKGFLGTDGRGESMRMIPESAMQGFKKPEQVIKRIDGGHYRNWINAFKGGDEPCSNFTIAGPYTEWLLLGTICWRFPNEKLLWDGARMRFTNKPAANEFVKPYIRKGWELKTMGLGV
ncbi:MAG: Gfo/Idh/MocA family oxidoreductase [Kiritimatiellaeota bacterium]|nr:Gfo/Idh/MocA family oxidoreductase [Kiritimatiellota bacterium]